MNKQTIIGSILLIMYGLISSCWGFSLPQPDTEKFATKAAFIQLEALDGKPEAMYLVGLMHITGDYLPQNIPNGLKWLKSAANKQSQAAQFTLGQIYYEGKLKPRSLQKAHYWYQKAAKSGDKSAIFQLGLIYASGGDGIKRHCGKAIDAFTSVDSHSAWGNIAWILATCPEKKFRNGQRAVTIAKKLVQENPNDATNLDNLAAAYAELGDFTSAVNYQKKAIKAIANEEQVEYKADFRQRLKNYQDQQPYRENN